MAFAAMQSACVLAWGDARSIRVPASLRSETEVTTFDQLGKEYANRVSDEANKLLVRIQAPFTCKHLMQALGDQFIDEYVTPQSTEAFAKGWHPERTAHALLAASLYTIARARHREGAPDAAAKFEAWQMAVLRTPLTVTLEEEEAEVMARARQMEEAQAASKAKQGTTEADAVMQEAYAKAATRAPEKPFPEGRPFPENYRQTNTPDWVQEPRSKPQAPKLKVTLRQAQQTKAAPKPQPQVWGEPRTTQPYPDGGLAPYVGFAVLAFACIVFLMVAFTH
jgi:hypothetical protein